MQMRLQRTIAREQLIAQFGKLSENSSDNEMVIADGDITIVQNSADFNADEKLLYKRNMTM